METITRYQRRVDDMHSGSTRCTPKRKSPSMVCGDYSRRSPFAQFSTGSLLPRHSEKRTKLWAQAAQSQGTSHTNESLYPYAATGALRYSSVSKGTASVLNSVSLNPVEPPSSPQLATGRPRFYPSMASPIEQRNLEVVLIPRREAETMDEMSRNLAALRLDLERARAEEMLATNALHRQRSNKLVANYTLAREQSQRLQDQMSLVKFKNLVNMRPVSGSKSHAAASVQEDSKTDIFPLEQGIRISNDSIYREVEVASGDISPTASLSDEQRVRSASRKNERVSSVPSWKILKELANSPSKVSQRKSRELQIEYEKTRLRALQLTRKSKLKPEEEKGTLRDAFTPLSEEAESAVALALGDSDRCEVLAMHEKSNIDVTRVVMQCLLPGAWLNDEVINVYMELLKERELQEPQRFLKCHFFNTFFYNKLYKDKRIYEYKAIRRWTTKKKLGYSITDCDKILVPIHQDIHWCLAVINIRDKKLEYLDSLKGEDGAVLKVLARYIADEAKDKDDKVLDASSWVHDFPKEIPEQLNGCDCGMFMVKYADFHSRGAPLSFTQDHMEYFRRKMVWEILQLKAT